MRYTLQIRISAYDDPNNCRKPGRTRAIALNGLSDATLDEIRARLNETDILRTTARIAGIKSSNYGTRNHNYTPPPGLRPPPISVHKRGTPVKPKRS